MSDDFSDALSKYSDSYPEFLSTNFKIPIREVILYPID